jgi:hypothetical protein
MMGAIACLLVGTIIGTLLYHFSHLARLRYPPLSHDSTTYEDKKI